MKVWLSLALIALGALDAQERDLSAVAVQGRRAALVVGNGAYRASAWQLQNAVNDANDLAAELESLGFEVTVVTDADLRTMQRLVTVFAGALQPGDIALFHYSGHGIQIDGDNYLIPVDFEARDEVDAKYASYPLTQVLDRLEQTGSRLNIIILDACRNNPFRAARGGDRGLAMTGAGRGMFVAFATGPGQTADDNRTGRNGLFTAHLLDTLREPGLSLDGVFNTVRKRVLAASMGRQLPWTSSSAVGEFYFRSEMRSGPPAVTGLDAETELHIDLTFWNSVKDSPGPSGFEAYLREFPNGRFASLARLQVEELRRAAVNPAPATQESNPAVPSQPASPAQAVTHVPTPKRETQAQKKAREEAIKNEKRRQEAAKRAASALADAALSGCSPGTVRVDLRAVGNASSSFFVTKSAARMRIINLHASPIDISDESGVIVGNLCSGGSITISRGYSSFALSTTNQRIQYHYTATGRFPDGSLGTARSRTISLSAGSRSGLQNLTWEVRLQKVR